MTNVERELLKWLVENRIAELAYSKRNVDIEEREHLRDLVIKMIEVIE